MDLGLGARSFIVTGGTRGLGFAAARALVDEGARVLVSSSSAEHVSAAVDELGDAAHGVTADITDSRTPSKLIDAARERFGRLDGLFVSHGGPPPGTPSELNDDAIRTGIEIATIAPVRMIRAVAADLGEGGSIVVLTSTSGSEPITGLASSNIARPAVQGYVKDLATEIGPAGIRVNALLPGRFDTERSRFIAQVNPRAKDDAEQAAALRRSGDPAELGSVAAFLLSPRSSYVTGAAWTVDGGRRATM
ncbi:SDR family oxidoreductase [Allosaccharopolyspora coralli]|uniref:SDR family oxidoreductase n=1 Tax=Allosaccharopolyspora coralli TaxID=2665642 RepID=A0A5Q3Q4W9_9PSEU|nr:SDR family oxidoreductase [Allosaccharopolyspora coralli]QGK69373.1 SDR family oxidoreductase [Allosaccharopolyspora coralli]